MRRTPLPDGLTARGRAGLRRSGRPASRPRGCPADLGRCRRSRPCSTPAGASVRASPARWARPWSSGPWLRDLAAGPRRGGADADAGDRPDTVLVGLGGGRRSGRRRRTRVAAAGGGGLRAGGGRRATAPPSCCPADRPAQLAVAAAAVAEGAVLAGYRYDDFRTGERPGDLGRPGWSPPVGRRRRPWPPRGRAAGPGWPSRWPWPGTWSTSRPARSRPSGSPSRSSERFAGADRLTVEVWDEERIAAERLGGLLGVAAGSAQPPRLVRVDVPARRPLRVDGRVPHLALVGKGITFDSGGLSLKTADGHGDDEDRHGRGGRRAGRGRRRRRPGWPDPRSRPWPR